MKYRMLSSLSLSLALGCGEAEVTATRSSAVSEQGGPTIETAVAVATAEAQAATSPPPAAPPTAEQIKRWTPAPFEPLELLGVYDWEKTSFTSKVAALPDGKHFLVVGSRVILWAIENNREPEHVFLELTSVDKDRDLISLDVSPDGKWFAVGDSNGVLRAWNLADKSEIATKELYGTGIQDLAISPDGKEIATITYDGVITIWNADKFEEINKFEPDTTQLQQIKYVSPGVLAVAGQTSATWNTATGKKLAELSAENYSQGFARSPDGSKFVFGDEEKLVIWDTKASTSDGEVVKAVSGREEVAFSPDGNFLAVNSGGTLQMWNVAEKRLVQVIDSYGWPMVGACWLPTTNLLVVASDIGITRVWGTPKQGALAKLKPLHTRIAEYDTPASPLQMNAVIDLRVVPRLPGSEVTIADSRILSCTVPVSADEAMTFYRHFLSEAGWAEGDPLSPNAPTLVFEKNGFRLTASFYESDGKTNVSITHEGNLDLRTVPKFAAAETKPSYESILNLSYSTKADLLTIETNLLRVMSAAGWTPYTRINTSHSEEADGRDMNFLKNGATLRVSVGKFPVAPDSYTISYSLFPNESSVPVPPDAGYVEFDGSTDPKLIAICNMDIDELTQFYDKELAKDDWIVREHGKSEKGDSAWLTYLRDQNDLTIGLAKLENGKTLVRTGEASGSLWDNSLPKEPGEEEEVVAGIQAADFPILNGSKTAKYDEIERTIEVVIENSTLANAAEIYQKAIEELGWKHDGRGIRDEQFTFLTFEKEGEDFSLRAHPKDGGVLVSFGGDGLLWTKPLPGGRDLVSYERWLRLNKLPPGLESLDRYETEMKSIAN